MKLFIDNQIKDSATQNIYNFMTLNFL